MSTSATIRRNGSSYRQPPSTTNPPTTTHPPHPLTTLLPTSHERLLLALYPSTLALGSLFSLLNPPAARAPYSALLQSHPAHLAPSYFATKSNLFNVLFVKIGWFWTSLAFFLFLFAHPSAGPPYAFVLTRKRLQGLLRYALLTVWWVVVTQWFFGPALIDRGFVLTGGACAVAEAKVREEGLQDVGTYATRMACKLGGGEWSGGHDISGHVFLLVLGSACLILEMLPVVSGGMGVRERRHVRREDGAVIRVERKTQEKEIEDEGKWGLGVPVTVAGLSLWMLLMTAAYFHTWFEKFTGLLVAFVGLAVVYFFPRAFPDMRSALGMPGV